MAKILSYFQLCPINDETGFLGLSHDVESGTVINTLGKNIIINVKLSTQKQVHSWAVQDKLSSKVVYDFNKKVYVGVFGHKWIRCWTSECNDINKVKRIKLSKPIESLISIPNENTIVLYSDGTCESLECAIDSRKEKKDLQLLANKPVVDPETTELLDATYFRTSNEAILLTYFTQSRESNDICLVFVELNSDTLRIERPVTKWKLARNDRNINLVGCTVVDNIMHPQLVTIWSDNRLFLMPLRNNVATSEMPGDFVAMLQTINVSQPLSVIGIDRDCIAIYGANANQDGASLILYNTQFKVIESKQHFKVYFKNPRLWVIEKFIFLAVGQVLGVVKFRVSKEQLSDMVGSQRATHLNSYVDTECLNADGALEDMIEFDTAANLAATHPLNHSHTNGVRTTIPSIENDPNKPYEMVEDVAHGFETLRNYDLTVRIEEDADLVPGMMHLKLLPNLNVDPFNASSIQTLANELERIGASEYEITNCMIPLLVQAKLGNDLLTCLRTYSNVSEQALAIALKYFVDLARAKTHESLTDDDKLVNGVNAVLANTFDQEMILEHLRAKLDTDDVLYLLNHIFAALGSDEVQLEERPQIDNSFGDDEQLIKWMCALIDSHFQQFLISRDTKIIKLLTKWKELIDGLVEDVQQTSIVSVAVQNLIDCKTIKNESTTSKWYSVEEFKLY